MSTLWYIPRRYIVQRGSEDAEGQAVGIQVRALRPRMAPSVQGSGAEGLPEVQEPVLEHAPQDKGVTSDSFARCQVTSRTVVRSLQPSFQHDPLGLLPWALPVSREAPG